MSKSKKHKSVCIITLGCSKNIVDSEKLLKQFDNNNVKILNEPQGADYLIINTCGFIEDAKQESIDTIFSALEEKNKGNVGKVFVIGCLSKRYKKELKEELPQVDAFFGTEDFQKIIESINNKFDNKLLNDRIITTPNHYAYLKISEGCNHKCSFCAIPLIKGKYVSRSITDLLMETRNLAEKGVKELIVIAQDTTYYGTDLIKRKNISDLLNKLSKVEGIEWLRLLYTHPKNFPDDLIELIKSNPKICKYIDIPIQHVSDKILASMKRGINIKKTKGLLLRIREKIPNVALRTTLIVGYPGETKKEFNELCDFIQEIRFNKLGVFTYSPEEGTGAFKIKDTIPRRIKEERKKIVMEIQEKISYNINSDFLGKVIKVLIDRKEEDYFVGRTEWDAPEVDGEVLIKNNKLKIGNFYDVRITDFDAYDLEGKIYNRGELK
ncbi:MAG: 30S ribosomal protein S12 methylthiotransferase RimO [Ignavibacteriales bacterium]|nr:30S ribosomal protein S12 methylthiotransferase RimO [Ignavibacteriales bacterium]